MIADVDYVGPYFFLRFIMESSVCMPIEVGFKFVSTLKGLSVENKN